VAQCFVVVDLAVGLPLFQRVVGALELGQLAADDVDGVVKETATFVCHVAYVTHHVINVFRRLLDL